MRLLSSAALLAAGLAALTSNEAVGAMNDEMSDATEIVRLLLADDRLLQYLDGSSADAPLNLANKSGLTVRPEDLGRDAQSVAPGSAEAKTALRIESIEMQEDRATLHFRYAPEGLRGTAVFEYDSQASRWTIIKIDIFET